MRPMLSPEANRPRPALAAPNEALPKAMECTTPQAEVHPPSSPFVEQIAGQITNMIAERAQERLRKAPAPAPEP